MMKAEKFTVYFILFFVILIISINIFSSLSMLLIDKRGDIETFISMGANKTMIARIFTLQGWLICVIGSSIGILIGLLLCFIQIQTGLIQIPGNFIVSAYPVSIQFLDVIITLSGVSIIGYLISAIPARVIKKNS
jgi:lipoprotein-releasing system permease protein